MPVMVVDASAMSMFNEALSKAIIVVNCNIPIKYVERVDCHYLGTLLRAYTLKTL